MQKSLRKICENFAKKVVTKSAREPKGTKEIDAKDKKVRLFKQNEKREGNHFLFHKSQKYERT